MRTDKPLLVSVSEACFQLSLPERDIAELVRDGELSAVTVKGQVLLLYDSLAAFTRRARRKAGTAEVAHASA